MVLEKNYGNYTKEDVALGKSFYHRHNLDQLFHNNRNDRRWIRIQPVYQYIPMFDFHIYLFLNISMI